MTANRYREFLFWDDENILELDTGVVAQVCECTKKPLKCTLPKGGFYDI